MLNYIMPSEGLHYNISSLKMMENGNIKFYQSLSKKKKR